MRASLIALLFIASWGIADEAKKPKEKAQAEEKAYIAEIRVRVDGTEDPHPAMPFGPRKLNYYGFLKFVRDAAKDPRIDAIQLKPEAYGVGWSRLLEVREALSSLKRAGKKIFVYKESLTAADLVIASVADRISVPEAGGVMLPGIAIESLYMKDMLAKLRIRFDVIHIGEYKSAGESLVRDSMSDELKESLDPVLDEFYATMIDAIAEGRGLKRETVVKAVDQGLVSATEAQKMGLIDRVEYEDQFKAGIKAYFPDKKLKRHKFKRAKGAEIDPNNPIAAMSMVFSLIAGGQQEPVLKGPKVAVVYCSGAITSGKSQYDWQGNIASMGSETIVSAIDKARKDDSVKAIVLRVNSPGGSALASDVIWRALERAKKVKPVIASMGDVAASGGYYISMGANSIFAEPQTITGSIGVVGMVPNVDDLYPWIGIKPERMTRGKRAAALMTSKGLSDEDKEIIRVWMKDVYGLFVSKVAAGRGKTPAEIEPIARGRIWTGRKAQQIGLVDRLGGLEDAIAYAKQKGGIEASLLGEDWHVVEYPRRAGPFEALQKMFEGEAEAKLGIDSIVLSRLPMLRSLLSRIEVLQRMGRDKVCLIQPELIGLAQPFAAANR